MNYPFYHSPTPKPDALAALPSFDYHAPNLLDTHTADYIADEGLSAAVNVALLLGKPLLLTGEPGTGKTTLAANLAYQLKLDSLLKFETKSSSQAQDLFYFYDALGHYQKERMRKADDPANNPLDFVQLHALGQAILTTYEENSEVYQSLKPCLGPDASIKSAQRSVVLIDEIDKAPSDFPNDILNEIEHYHFHLREWQNRKISVQAQRKPIIIITSNSEKHLPNAFMRRCVYYHIPFPEPERLEQICVQHLQALYQENDPKLKPALALFSFLRAQDLEKAPATAELIDWLRILKSDLFAQENTPCAQDSPALRQSLCSLLKNSKDQTQILGEDANSGALLDFFAKPSPQ